MHRSVSICFAKSLQKSLNQTKTATVSWLKNLLVKMRVKLSMSWGTNFSVTMLTTVLAQNRRIKVDRSSAKNCPLPASS